MDWQSVRIFPLATCLFQILLVHVMAQFQMPMPMFPGSPSLSFPPPLPAFPMESPSPVELTLVEAKIPQLPHSRPPQAARQSDHISQAEGEATFARDDKDSVSISVPVPPMMRIKIPSLPPPEVCWMNPDNPVCPSCPPCICKPSCTPSYFSYCSPCHKKCRCKFEQEPYVGLTPKIPLPSPFPPMPFAVGFPPPGAPILAIPSYKRIKNSHHKSYYPSEESSCDSDTDFNSDTNSNSGTDSDTGTDFDFYKDSECDDSRHTTHRHKDRHKDKHSRHSYRRRHHEHR